MRQRVVTAIALTAMMALAQLTLVTDSKLQLSWVAPAVPEIQRLSDALVGKWRTREKLEAMAAPFTMTKTSFLSRRLRAPVDPSR